MLLPIAFLISLWEYRKQRFLAQVADRVEKRGIASFLKRVLIWLSRVYAGMVRLRAWLYEKGVFRKRRLNGVVISVGNLTVGGTGKTPMVMWLAQKLYQPGKPVGILTRGYRSASVNPLSPVRRAEGGPRIMSDETWMLERRLGKMVRLGIGPNRYQQGRKLEAAGVQWFVLDDGFQHIQLHRDLDIVMIDGTNPFGEGYLLPAGILREPLSALLRADIVVITRCDSAPQIEHVIRKYSTAAIFYARTELASVESSSLSDVQAAPGEWLGKKVFAFAAIGHPQAFFDDVRHWGMNLVGQKPYPDHYLFESFAALAIQEEAEKAGAEALVCTDKDCFNLQNVRFERLPLFVCSVRLKLAREEEFWKVVTEQLEAKRAMSEL